MGHDHAGEYSQSFFIEKKKKDFHYIPHAKGSNITHIISLSQKKRILPVSILNSFLKV
jgi:hypothetical protein